MDEAHRARFDEKYALVRAEERDEAGNEATSSSKANPQLRGGDGSSLLYEDSTHALHKRHLCRVFHQANLAAARWTGKNQCIGVSGHKVAQRFATR